jgi:DNA-directed RNA polymerase subunit delta
LTARERLAYVRGLLQGSDFLGSDEKTKEVWNGLLDVLEELSNEMDDIYDWQDEIEDYLDALDNDLMELEETVYEDEDEDEIVVVECPNCHEDIYVDESLFDDYDELVCPSCGSSICCECCDDDVDFEDDFDFDEDDE